MNTAATVTYCGKTGTVTGDGGKAKSMPQEFFRDIPVDPVEEKASLTMSPNFVCNPNAMPGLYEPNYGLFGLEYPVDAAVDSAAQVAQFVIGFTIPTSPSLDAEGDRAAYAEKMRCALPKSDDPYALARAVVIQQDAVDGKPPAAYCYYRQTVPPSAATRPSCKAMADAVCNDVAQAMRWGETPKLSCWGMGDAKIKKGPFISGSMIGDNIPVIVVHGEEWVMASTGKKKFDAPASGSGSLPVCFAEDDTFTTRKCAIDRGTITSSAIFSRKTWGILVIGTPPPLHFNQGDDDFEAFVKRCKALAPVRQVDFVWVYSGNPAGAIGLINRGILLSDLEPCPHDSEGWSVPVALL